MAGVPSWDEFVRENLLCSSLICGVCLLSQHGEKVYTHGQLTSLPESETQQFVQVFRTTSQAAEQELIQKGFSLSYVRNKPARQFRTYSKTFSSAYATSTDGQMGLAVNKLPYGILVCLFSNSSTTAKTVKLVEQFCDKLRS